MADVDFFQFTLQMELLVHLLFVYISKMAELM